MARTTRTAVAAMEFVLVAPALIFFGAIFFRNFFPISDNGAEQIVRWYAGRHWSLWVLLIALPAAVLILGISTLFQSWSEEVGLRRDTGQALTLVRSHLSIVLIGSATFMAGIILAFVAVHMLLN